MAVFAELRVVGAPLAALFAGLALIRAVVRQDLGELGKLLLLRLPLALIGSSIALELVVLALRATDSIAEALLSAAGGSTATFTSALAVALVTTGGAAGGFAAFVVASVCGFIAFCLWVELVVRSSAIAIAALFIPLALAGAVWPSTAAWGRRLAEVLGSLILSKVAIAGVFALAVNEIGSPNGLTGLIQGTSLLLLATFAPWALLHLIPAVEVGAISQLEGLGGRAVRAAGFATGDLVDRASGSSTGFTPPLEPQLPLAESSPMDSSEFLAHLAHFEATLPPAGTPRAASLSGTAQDGGSSSGGLGDVTPEDQRG
jgi:hypothetical protein